MILLFKDKRRFELPRVYTQIISNYPYFANSRLSIMDSTTIIFILKNIVYLIYYYTIQGEKLIFYNSAASSLTATLL